MYPLFLHGYEVKSGCGRPGYGGGSSDEGLWLPMMAKYITVITTTENQWLPNNFLLQRKLPTIKHT